MIARNLDAQDEDIHVLTLSFAELLLLENLVAAGIGAAMLDGSIQSEMRTIYQSIITLIKQSKRNL